jgi:hypothetical protein
VVTSVLDLRLGMVNTPELQDHHIGHYFPQMICRPREGLHDWVRQTPQRFEITVLEFINKHKV